MGEITCALNAHVQLWTETGNEIGTKQDSRRDPMNDYISNFSGFWTFFTLFILVMAQYLIFYFLACDIIIY